MRLWGLRLGLLAASLALALGVAEIALGALRSAAPRRGEGPQVTRHDPLLGWSLVPGAQGRHRTAEYDVAVRISSQGWRADRSYSPVPGPGIRRIVAVGDSFTFGQGVEAEETFASRLERLLPSTEVINLGVSGYGTDQQLLLLQHRGLALRPDTVVLGLLVTNVFRNDDEAHGRYAKPVFRLGPGGRLALANVPVPAPVPAPAPAPVPRPGPATGPALAAPPRPGGLLARSRLANFVRTRLEYGGHGPAWPVTAAILGEAARLCHGAGADLVVLVIPTQDAVQGSPADRRRQAAMVRRVAALVPRGEAEVVDPTPVLVARFDAEPAVPLFYEKDGHLTAAGHRVLAEVLARRLAPPGGDIGCMDAGSLAADEET